ncbi:MAG: M28 family peptidase [Gemmatimonadaceae bacterium]
MTRLSLLAAAVILAPAIIGAQAPQAPQAEPSIAVVPAPATGLPLEHAPQPTAAGITPQDLMTRLYIFADDSMQGREAGTIGNVKGTDYIAAEVKRLGLVPAGENGTYFQTLPFKTRALASDSRFVVAGSPLTLGTDWAATGTSSLKATDLQVVYAGTIGETSIPESETAGKLVVLRVPADPAAARGSLRGAHAAAPKAAAIALVGLDRYIGFLVRPATFVDDPKKATAETPLTLVISGEAAERIFGNALDMMSPGSNAGAATLDVRTTVAPVPYPARNVVAILPGSDPALRGQYVAVGAHNDHVGFNDRPADHDSVRIFNHVVRPGGAEDSGNQATPAQQAEVNRQLAALRQAHPGTARPDSIFNGADDDGSGSVAVLEIAESMSAAAVKPKRSMLFVWHVGEEKGLLGSAYFTDNPTVPRDSIVAQLNMDMVGRGNASDVTGTSKAGEPLRGNDDYLQLVGSRRLSKELGDLVEQVNTEGRFLFKFDYSMDADGHPANIYCRSDHYEYARYGIPITFFTTGVHSDYHMLTDEPQYIDYDQMTRVTGLVEAIAMRVANLDHRVALDGPKPDPNGSCRQ